MERRSFFVKFFARNIQFLAVVVLQVMTVIILFVMLFQCPQSGTSEKNKNLYGLQKEDFKRLKDTYNNKGESEIIEHSLGHYKAEENIESETVSVNSNQEFVSEVLVLIHKWQKLDGPEKEQVAKEIGNKVKNRPEVKKIIHDFVDSLEKNLSENK
jgi:hypothetical protein